MRCWAFAALVLASCDRHSATATATATTTATTTTTTTATATSTSTATATATSTATRTAASSTTSSSSTSRPTPCGALECAQYDSARDAFLAAVSGDPLVVGIGEAHRPRGETAASAAKRFTEEMLPLLAGRASDLLVELMMPPSGCADAAAEVREKQKPATERQAETNQNEYVAMGDRARALGIVPDMLRPTCGDMDAVRRAGDGAVEASLDMIARLTTRQAERLADRDTRSDADRGKAVVVYGGMLHNDLAPAPQTAKWSYVVDVDAHVRGRFVAVDLVVPEFITDDAIWRALPWWSHYDRAKLGAKATLFKTADRSFVLVFPTSS